MKGILFACFINIILAEVGFIATREEYDKKIEEKGNRCILISNKEEDRKSFEIISQAVKEFEFYYTNEVNAKEAPCVMILRDFEERQITYKEPLDKLKDFLIEHSKDYVKTLDMITSLEIFYKKDKKAILLITPKEEDKHINEVFRLFAISKQSSNYTFAKLIKKNEDWSKKLIKYLRVTDKDIPRIEIFDPTEMEDRPKRYVFEGEIELSKLQKFLDDYEQGVLTQFNEPEPEPEPEYVIELTISTYKLEVLHNDYDVLVYFYADDCILCNLFESVYKSVAETLKDNKKLKLTKINGGKNKVKGIYVNSYPSIYLYPSDEKDYPIPFTEEVKNKRNLIDFLKEHCKHPIHEIKEDL